MQVKVLARVLRTIDKCGGLDGYLLGEKSGRVKELGVEGWRLRWMVMRTGKVRRRIRGVKGEMGLLTMGRKDGELTRGVEEGLEHEVERTSEEVIERIENSNQARSEIIETTLAPPPSEPTPLESHINLTTLAIEAETARQSQPPTPGTNTPPSHSNPADESPPEGPSRRFTKGEKRAWRASHRNPPNSDHVAESTLDGSASALMAEVARIEGAVEGEMAAGMEKEGRERLEAAMEMLRRAAEELERVKGEGRGMGREKGAEGGKGGVLGRIRGLLWRG